MEGSEKNRRDSNAMPKKQASISQDRLVGVSKLNFHHTVSTMLRLQNSFILIIGVLGVFIVANEPEPVCPPIVSRADWGARPPKAVTNTPFPMDKAIIIRTATPQCFTRRHCSARLRMSQQFFMSERNFSDIGYSFVIGGDGDIFEGVGWRKAGNHTHGYNSNSLGIAFIGNFEHEGPGDLMMNALHNLLTCAVQKGELTADYKLLGQKQVSETYTKSPGRKLYEVIQRLPNWAESP